MENRGPVLQTESERLCQIEGCNDVTVGARTSLCRKHRNNKYKQNYKKKKRKAQGTEENQGEALENQLAVEKYHLEQKYASMLQQVLVQKRLELLQSPSICNLLRIHQQNVRENKQKELLDKRKAAQDERNSKMQQEKQSKSFSATNSSTSSSSITCISVTTTKLTNGPSKSTSSSKTLVKSSKQSSRPAQGRNTSKQSKNRNNSNSGVESTINGLAPHCKITSSGNEQAGHTMYAASAGVWNLAEAKSDFVNLRQVQNFPQQQQVAPQQMLVNPTQQALQQQNQSHNMQAAQLLQHFQPQNIPKEQLQYLQHQNVLEQAHQKQLQEKKQQQQQLQQQQRQQQQRLQEQQLVQQQQQQLSQQRRLHQQRQQELHIQLQNSRQQQLQQQQQQQQQRQQLQGTNHQTQQQVHFHQQQQQQQQQHQTCTSVASSVKNISGTELLLQSLPSIQSSMSSLLVSQSYINTSSNDSISTSGILTTRHSVLPRTVHTNTHGKTTPTGVPINHMVSNVPSVTSHRPIAPRLEGHPSINNTLCNGGMPIITAIISAPLTQQIMPQCTPNVERNSLHIGADGNTMNSSGNTLNNHYPLMPFNVQMDMNLLQGVGAQVSEQNVQCAPTQIRGRQMLLD